MGDGDRRTDGQIELIIYIRQQKLKMKSLLSLSCFLHLSLMGGMVECVHF